MAERDCFRQLLVQPKDLRNRARDLRNLERVRQPRAMVIVGLVDQNLRLVHQPAKGGAMDDAIPIARIERAKRMRFFRMASAATVPGAHGVWREDFILTVEPIRRLKEPVVRARHK